MSSTLRTLWLLPLLFSPASVGAQDASQPARLLRGHDFEGLPASGAAQAVYAKDPAHPLNQLHALLFLAELAPDEVGAALPTERKTSGVDAEHFFVGKWPIAQRKGTPADRRWFGGDVRTSPLVALDPARDARLVELCARFDTREEVAQVSELASPLAKLLLQWDALQVLVRMDRKDFGSADARRALHRVVMALAQPRAALEALPSGLADLHAQVPTGSAEDRRAPFLDRELLQDAAGPWVEVQRRSTALFDAKNSLRSARAFLRTGKREDALAFVAAVRAAKSDAELPKLARGAEVALVLTLVGVDTEGRAVATPVIDEVRLRALAGAEELSAANDTSSRDGWNHWVFARTRRGSLVAGDEGAFRFVPDTAQSLFLEYGTAKHATYAAQCALCHRATNGGGQAPSGVRMLSRFAEPEAITQARTRLDQAEREVAPVLVALAERYGAAR
ncbi:MAG: hypothetical protein IPJ77_11860 [Planctomycetes bacterium]|nr:hypothetical protein [Planctomycetota bacterium]